MSEIISAAKHGYYQQVISLLNSGACVDAKDKDQATPLYYSACSGNRDICVALLESGSDANSKVKWGSTPLHAAADRGHILCVQILLKFGSNPNIQNSRGESPLHLSAYRGYLEIVTILISARSNPFLKNKSHKTAAQEAESQNHRIIVHRLREYMNNFKMGTLTERPDLAIAVGHKRNPLIKSFSDTSMFPNSANHENVKIPENEQGEIENERNELNDLNRPTDSDRPANNFTRSHRKLSRTDSLPNSYGGRDRMYYDEFLTGGEVFGYGDHELCGVKKQSFTGESSSSNEIQGVPSAIRHLEHPGTHGTSYETKSYPVAAYAEALQLKVVHLQQENENLTKDSISMNDDLEKCKKTLDNYQSLLLRYSKDREHLKNKIQKSNSSEYPQTNSRVDVNSSIVPVTQNKQGQLWKISYTHNRVFQLLRISPDCARGNIFDDKLLDALNEAFPFWGTKSPVDTSKKEWKPLVDYVFRDRKPLNQRHDGSRDGSCSLVFKISCDGKPYILKMMINLLNLDFTEHGDGNSMTGFLSMNFGSEYKIPLRLSSHPGILKIYHYYEGSLEHFRDYLSLLVPQNLDVPIDMANRSTFLIMKEYPTTLMKFVVDQREKHKDAPYGMSEQFTLHIMYQLFSTLWYLQQSGVVHRDIKADNVFLDWRLRPVLADFGFARRLCDVDGSDIPCTATRDIYAGNPRAWAPELVRSSRMESDSLPKDLSLRKLYEKSDAFAVARMFYNLLCPLDDDCYFPRSSAERPHYDEKEIPSLPSCYSVEISHVMKKLVLSDPSQRITAKEARLRIGMMLFGPMIGELRDKSDVKIYKQSRIMKLLCVEVQEIEPENPSFHVSVEDSVNMNSSWIEANFLSQITEDELWELYCEQS